MDGVFLLAARFLCGTSAGYGPQVPPRPGPQGTVRAPARPEQGRRPARAWKTTTRGGCLVETVNTTSTGRARSPRALPELFRGNAEER